MLTFQPMIAVCPFRNSPQDCRPLTGRLLWVIYRETYPLCSLDQTVCKNPCPLTPPHPIISVNFSSDPHTESPDISGSGFLWSMPSRSHSMQSASSSTLLPYLSFQIKLYPFTTILQSDTLSGLICVLSHQAFVFPVSSQLSECIQISSPHVLVHRHLC